MAGRRGCIAGFLCQEGACFHTGMSCAHAESEQTPCRRWTTTIGEGLGRHLHSSTQIPRELHQGMGHPVHLQHKSLYHTATCGVQQGRGPPPSVHPLLQMDVPQATARSRTAVVVSCCQRRQSPLSNSHSSCIHPCKRGGLALGCCQGSPLVAPRPASNAPDAATNPTIVIKDATSAHLVNMWCVSQPLPAGVNLVPPRAVFDLLGCWFTNTLVVLTACCFHCSTSTPYTFMVRDECRLDGCICVSHPPRRSCGMQQRHRRESACCPD